MKVIEENIYLGDDKNCLLVKIQALYDDRWVPTSIIRELESKIDTLTIEIAHLVKWECQKEDGS